MYTWESPTVSPQRRAVTLLPAKLTERAAIFKISDSVNSYLRLCREQLTQSEEDEDTSLVAVLPSSRMSLQWMEMDESGKGG